MSKTKRRDPEIILRDFGYGVFRIDIDRIAIGIKVNCRTGKYEGLSISSVFDFKLMQFARKLDKFIKGDMN